MVAGIAAAAVTDVAAGAFPWITFPDAVESWAGAAAVEASIGDDPWVE